VFRLVSLSGLIRNGGLLASASSTETIAAIRPRRRRWLTRGELVQRLGASQADAGLREDLAELAGETTGDLDAL